MLLFFYTERRDAHLAVETILPLSRLARVPRLHSAIDEIN
jgi:hypothetical protein